MFIVLKKQNIICFLLRHSLECLLKNKSCLTIGSPKLTAVHLKLILNNTEYIKLIKKIKKLMDWKKSEKLCAKNEHWTQFGEIPALQIQYIS